MTVRTFCRGPHMLHIVAAVYFLGLVWLALEAKYNCPILEWHD